MAEAVCERDVYVNYVDKDNCYCEVQGDVGGTARQGWANWQREWGTTPHQMEDPAVRRANDEVSESEDYFTASYLTFDAGTGRYHQTPLIQKWSQVDTENSKLAFEW